MIIRAAKAEELFEIENIYSDARAFMRESGNSEQWKNSYPSRELIESDIKNGNLYVCEDVGGALLCVFYYKTGNDKTYEKITMGEWKNDFPYGVIHRIAVSKNSHGKGVAKAVFDYAFSLCGNLKIDTHKDNIPMQRALEKCGFSKCGIIYIESGEERIAYQKTF